jgi:nucleoside-diphosphate-sugar epimerase
MTFYLVTGGTGFLGSALVRHLVAARHRVRVLDNNWRGHPRRLEGVLDAIDMRVGDIRDPATVRNAVDGVDSVVHMSAVNGTRFFYEEPELVFDVAVRGMFAIVDACRDAGVRDLVVASSSEVYQSPPLVPTPEDVPLIVPDVLNPRFSYGGSKLATELMAMIYGARGFDRVTVFRPHNVYGPDMGFEHVVPEFSLRAHDLAKSIPAGRPLPFPILGSGAQTRAFISVEDFTRGLATVVARGEHRNVYHIGTSEEISIRRLAEIIVAAVGREPEIVNEPAPIGETMRRCPDVSKLRALGWEPRDTLSTSLPAVVSWYGANSHLRPNASTKERSR